MSRPALAQRLAIVREFFSREVPASIGAVDLALTRERRALDFLTLTKPRVVVMILMTTVVGYHLGSAGPAD